MKARAVWNKFWEWHHSFYTSSVLILSPRSGGEYMQVSPQQVIGSLLASLKDKGATEEQDPQKGEYPEGCIIEPEDEFRLRQVVTPEELVALVTARTTAEFPPGDGLAPRVDMTWEDAQRIFNEVMNTYDLE